MANRANAVLRLAIVCLVPVTTAASAANHATQEPTFRVAIDMVTLDVIPRGANGRFVPNLVADDFQVLEDAVPQKVASLVLVNGGRVYNLTLPAPPATASPDGLVLPAARVTTDAGGRVFVLIVDDLHFTATETPVVRALLHKVIAKLFHDGDMVAMFSTGSSSIEIPVSYDRKLLEGAVSKVSGHGMSYRDIMDARDGSQGPQGLRYQAHVAFKTAYELLGNLERVRNRRKALILVSNGYDFDPFPAGRTGTDLVFGGRYGSPWVNPDSGDRFLALEKANNQFADADLASELAAVTGIANRVNASIYAIDPRGVAGTTSVAEHIDMTEMRTHIGKTQGSLQVLSEATGGFAVINDNTYDEALMRIDAETSDYYILGYYSTNNDATRRNRQVEVKAARPGVQVASRGWYRTRSQPVTPPRQ
jgi:VWFA-related protein